MSSDSGSQTRTNGAMARVTTRRWTVDPSLPAAELGALLGDAAALLAGNETVAFPTETVYGLGANALSSDAIGKVFAAKGRPSDNPLIVHVCDADMAKSLVKSISPAAQRLMDAFWPGPLTVLLPSNGSVSAVCTAGLSSVGIRMPSHPVALALIREAGVPVAAPSANVSGRPSPTRAAHVLADLDGRIAGVVDGGATGVGLESTVVECSWKRQRTDGTVAEDGVGGGGVGVVSEPRAKRVKSDEKQQQQQQMETSGADVEENDEYVTVLRPGGVTVEQLRAVVPDVRMDPSLDMASRVIAPSDTFEQDDDSEQKSAAGGSSSSASDLLKDESNANSGGPRAPGMKYVHYAPCAPLYIVSGSEREFARLVRSAHASQKRVGVLATAELLSRLDALRSAESDTDVSPDVCVQCGSEQELEAVARDLYDGLRAFDDSGVDLILAQGFDSAGIGLAVMNRLLKASGRRVFVEK